MNIPLRFPFHPYESNAKYLPHPPCSSLACFPHHLHLPRARLSDLFLSCLLDWVGELSLTDGTPSLSLTCDACLSSLRMGLLQPRGREGAGGGCAAPRSALGTRGQVAAFLPVDSPLLRPFLCVRFPRPGEHIQPLTPRGVQSQEELEGC